MGNIKKIFFFLPDYPDCLTGGILYHKIMFDYFRGNSHSVFTTGNKGVIRFLLRHKFAKPLGGLLLYLKLPSKSVIVLTNTEYVHFLLPVICFKFLKRHKIYMVVHHLLSKERESIVKEKFENKFIGKADKVVTVSDVTLESLEQKGLISRKIPVINPGMNFPVLSYKQYTETGEFNILYVGTIEERKGLIYAVRSMLSFKNENVTLNVVGNVLQHQYFESAKNMVKINKLEKNVKFLGKLKKSELSSLLRNSDIFLFPSMWEGYGMVVAEAIAFGLPVICSSIPTMKYFVENGVNGFIVDVKNPDLISQKIRELKENIGLRKLMSQASLKKARSLPSWDDVCEIHYKLVSEM